MGTVTSVSAATRGGRRWMLSVLIATAVALALIAMHSLSLESNQSETTTAPFLVSVASESGSPVSVGSAIQSLAEGCVDTCSPLAPLAVLACLLILLTLLLFVVRPTWTARPARTGPPLLPVRPVPSVASGPALLQLLSISRT